MGISAEDSQNYRDGSDLVYFGLKTLLVTTNYSSYKNDC